MRQRLKLAAVSPRLLNLYAEGEMTLEQLMAFTVSDDRRARFVGAEAYAAAGGIIMRDLFSEDDGGWFQDMTILERLVGERLTALAGEIKAEGWAWVEAAPANPRPESSPGILARNPRPESSSVSTPVAGARRSVHASQTAAGLAEL